MDSSQLNKYKKRRTTTCVIHRLLSTSHLEIDNYSNLPTNSGDNRCDNIDIACWNLSWTEIGVNFFQQIFDDSINCAMYILRVKFQFVWMNVCVPCTWFISFSYIKWYCVSLSLCCAIYIFIQFAQYIVKVIKIYYFT